MMDQGVDLHASVEPVQTMSPPQFRMETTVPGVVGIAAFMLLAIASATTERSSGRKWPYESVIVLVRL
jgi:hypothetical protein